MAMEWSNDASLALIEEYRNQPALWDARHQMYTSKSHKQEAWDTIAASMQLSVEEVKQKMNSLLGSFRREKSRMKKNKDGNGHGYYSRWFAFEKMQFLMRDDETDETGVKFEEEDSIFDDLKYPLQDPAEALQSEKQPPMSSIPTRRRKKVVKAAPDPLQEDFSIFPPQDEYTAFGQYLACKLRKYDVRTRAFAVHAINNVLFEAEMGKYDNVQSPFESNHQDWMNPGQTASPTLNDFANGT